MNNLFGNKENFEKLFKDYYPILCHIVRGYIKSESIVEEIVCETFIKLWNNEDKIRIKYTLKDYLIRAVINTAIDYYRKEKVHKERIIHIEDNAVVCTTLADLDEDPLNYLINNEEREKVISAIEKLPDRYKTTFKLYRFDDLSYEEIAQKMGITKNTVKSNLRDALIILRDLLLKADNQIFFIFFLFL